MPNFWGRIYSNEAQPKAIRSRVMQMELYDKIPRAI